MTAKTNKQRQAEWKACQRAKGLKRVPDIWARPEDHKAILLHAKAINEWRCKEMLPRISQDGVATFNSVVISSQYYRPSTTIFVDRIEFDETKIGHVKGADDIFSARSKSIKKSKKI